MDFLSWSISGGFVEWIFNFNMTCLTLSNFLKYKEIKRFWIEKRYEENTKQYIQTIPVGPAIIPNGGWWRICGEIKTMSHERIIRP